LLIEQEDDIKYLFRVFADPKTTLITKDSLIQSLKHLSIRESEDKVMWLMAFANEESFSDLVLNEKVHSLSAVSSIKSKVINFEAFKRTFLRSSFLSANRSK